MLGLNLYESRAYVALLNGKQLTAKRVGEVTLIPQSRTYDVMESLAKKGFAQATPTTPPAYVPVPPQKILRSRYDVERKKIQDRVASVDEEAQLKLDTLREAYLALTKELPAVTEGGTTARERVWVLTDRENIEDTLVGLIKDAKSQVLRITKPPEPKDNAPFDPFYILRLDNQKFVADAIERKVEMRWLSLAREIPTYLGLEVNEPPERRYLDSDEDINEKFLLVDNHSVLLNLHDPMSSAYGYVALAMQSEAVSSIFQDHFEKMWRRGRPLGDVLPRMELLVEETCKELKELGLRRTDVLLYETLAKSGAIPKETLIGEMMRKRVQPQDTTISCEGMIKAGLVHLGSAHRLLMVEHPQNVRASIAAGKLGTDSRGGTTHRPSSGKNFYIQSVSS